MMPVLNSDKALMCIEPIGLVESHDSIFCTCMLLQEHPACLIIKALIMGLPLAYFCKLIGSSCRKAGSSMSAIVSVR